MNKKIDINKFERRIPFSVPSGYFKDLKFEIQNKCISKEKGFVFQYSSLSCSCNWNFIIFYYSFF